MNAFQKISLLLGFQLLLIISLVGAAWTAFRFSNLQKQIPPELLQTHRQRLGWLPIIPIVGYFICSLIDDFFGKLVWARPATGLCFILIGFCFFLRAMLTLRSPKNLPRGLILLVLCEMILSLLAIAVGMAMLQAR